MGKHQEQRFDSVVKSVVGDEHFAIAEIYERCCESSPLGLINQIIAVIRHTHVRLIIEREKTMNLRKSVIAATAAASLIVIPTIAQAAPAQANAASKLSIRSAPAVRQGVRVAKVNKQDGGGSLIIALLAAAAVVAGIVIAADGGSKSP
jgi:hypothetical protein